MDETESAAKVRREIIKILEPYDDNPTFILTSLMALITEISEIIKISPCDFKSMLDAISEQYKKEVRK